MEFAQGRELIDIIESHDWLLYDVTYAQKEDRAFTWEELEETCPATQLEMEHQYLFVPKPKDGETLRDAYSVTKGLGPSLTIEDHNDDKWRSLSVSPKCIPGFVAFFSRLFMDYNPDFAVVSSPPTSYYPDPDFVAIPYNKLFEVFRDHFRIVKPEECGLSTPISSPVIPTNN